VDLQRYTTLLAQDSISEQTLATQKALVLQDEGTVKTDQAAIDAAKLNLVYCHIASPIPGRAGLQQVNIGNFVTSGEPNGLVVITQLQPITVAFTLAEDEVPALLAQMRAGKTLPATAYDRSHVTKLASGTLQSIDSQIDPTTGTLKMKAIFSNDEGTLFPQQFVNVDLLLDTLHGAVLIPQAAVQRGAPGTYVYVLNADSTVNVRKVTLGPGDANDIAVTKGLAAGEKVVIDGADRLKDGAKVAVREPNAKANGAAAGSQAPPGSGKGHGQHRRQQQGQGAPGDHGGQTGSQ
jgi:membrane fusion protein, multidrug efflux system